MKIRGEKTRKQKTVKAVKAEALHQTTVSHVSLLSNLLGKLR